MILFKHLFDPDDDTGDCVFEGNQYGSVNIRQYSASKHVCWLELKHGLNASLERAWTKVKLNSYSETRTKIPRERHTLVCLRDRLILSRKTPYLVSQSFLVLPHFLHVCIYPGSRDRWLNNFKKFSLDSRELTTILRLLAKKVIPRVLHLALSEQLKRYFHNVANIDFQ